MKLSSKALTAAALMLVASQAFPSARLTYLIKSRPLSLGWSNDAFPIHYVLDPAAATQLKGAETVRKGMESWNGVKGSRVSFQSDAAASVKAGRDGKNSITLQDKLFEGSGFIAFTTTFYDDNARIYEADIQVDGAALANVNIEKLVAHEAGHMLGLDHSAVLSSMMYPYVGAEATGLDSDDRIAVAAMYPADGQKGGTLRGGVNGPSGAIFAAQVVALDDRGAAVASALTDSNGNYQLDMIPPGRYRVYAEPLDGPVDVQNLSGVWRAAAKPEFRTEFLNGGRQIEVTSGSVMDRLDIRNDGLPATLNPRWIGSFPAGSDQVRLGSNAATVKAGESISIAVGGDGIVGGLTEFEVQNAGFARVSDFRYGSNYLYATFKVAANVPSSSLAIVVKTGNETAALTGAVKVEGSSSSTTPAPEPVPAPGGGSSRRRAAR